MPRYSLKKLHRLLRESDGAATSDEKGAKLEELVAYLFGKIPGVQLCDKNVLDGPRAHEIDVVFWSPQNTSELCFLDAVLIVECKNFVGPVGSIDVGWFVRKLQVRGALSAVLVSLSSITGAHDGLSNAHDEILTALTRDGIRILLVTRAEILSLRDSDQLVELLKSKFLKLALRRTI